MCKNYYAAHSYMGTDYTYDSPCWMVHVFPTRQSRDKWTHDHMYANGNIVAETVSRKTAERIAPDIRNGLKGAHRVVVHDNNGDPLGLATDMV